MGAIFWVDTHCHLDAPEFFADTDTVRSYARAQGVQHVVIPSVALAPATATAGCQLAHRYGDSYALGIHPLYTGQAAEGDITALGDLLHQQRDDPHLVAIGEIGLDCGVPGFDMARQEHFYRAQLQLARSFGLPVILHMRQSTDRVLKGLREVPVSGGIAHAFQGSLQQAQALIALGFKLGFGGALSFDRALRLRLLARHLPIESLVLETDSPYMPPCWLYRTAAERATGTLQSRNTPTELPRIAQILAGMRGIALHTLAEQTTANAIAALPRLKFFCPPYPPPQPHDPH